MEKVLWQKYYCYWNQRIENEEIKYTFEILQSYCWEESPSEKKVMQNQRYDSSLERSSVTQCLWWLFHGSWWKQELLLHKPYLIVTDGAGSATEDDTDSQYKRYGYVILFLGRLQRETGISKYHWRKDKTIVVRKCKTNIIKGNSSHQGSSGNYYSFGNRADYGITNDSSITQYILKNYKSDLSLRISEQDA